jgi:2-keto-4-pentenoate hydratase/2-oxohepta-3-ene-1,7-dioic acid hydratase in catechol pathway
MKLARFSHQGRVGVGRVRGDMVFALEGITSIEALLADWPASFSMLPDDDRGHAVALADVALHAPIVKPSKFLAIAANYQSHIDEVKASNPDYVPPTSQRWFAKLPSCINGPSDPILQPPESRQLDYEVELAIVIGRRCRRVKAADAASVIAGYTICNDVSARDWQKRSPTIMLGKSFDTHGPLGPWLVTPDEIGDPHALSLKCWVNGELRQSGSTSEMIDNCFAQIEYLSTVCTLEPGDVIATGTPFGTGGSMKPPRFLQPGDVVRCEVGRIGAIEAMVIAEDRP